MCLLIYLSVTLRKEELARFALSVGLGALLVELLTGVVLVWLFLVK